MVGLAENERETVTPLVLERERQRTTKEHAGEMQGLTQSFYLNGPVILPFSVFLTLCFSRKFPSLFSLRSVSVP